MQQPLQDPDEIIKALVKKFDYMFQHESLMRSQYLINRATIHLEIPFSVIYLHNFVLEVTRDTKLIIDALKQCKLITVHEDRGLISVNKSTLRRKVVVRHLQESQLNDFKQEILVEKFLPLHNLTEKDIDIIYAPERKCLSILFKGENDEQLALDFLKWVSNENFQNSKIDCNIEEESLLGIYRESFKQNKKPMGRGIYPPPYYHQQPFIPTYGPPQFWQPPMQQHPGPVPTMGPGGTPGGMGGEPGVDGRGPYVPRGRGGGYQGRGGYNPNYRGRGRGYQGGYQGGYQRGGRGGYQSRGGYGGGRGGRGGYYSQGDFDSQSQKPQQQFSSHDFPSLEGDGQPAQNEEQKQ